MKVTHEDGTVEYITLERADNPSVVGTPINKVLFDSINDDLLTRAPAGLIALWHGSTIPTGWLLCDGTNGTPDLRDKFIVGAGSTYSIGDTGGEATHVLTTNEMPNHNHELSDLSDVGLSVGTEYTSSRVYAGTSDLTPTSTSSHAREIAAVTDAAGGGQAHNNLPPYYALAFIMKQ